MKTIRNLRIPTIGAMIVMLLLSGFQSQAMAGMVGNVDLASQTELQMQRDDARQLLDREDVRTALLDYGINPADAESRIDNLTASELTQLQQQLADLPAGAGGGALGVILAIILILVLLDVLGATDVFPRI
jgi:hypothetical protein